MYDESFTRELVEASVAVAAVAGPGKRSRAKKAAAKTGDLEETEKASEHGRQCQDILKTNKSS